MTQFQDAYSNHACHRAQNRAIPAIAADLLRQFGNCRRAGDGCNTYFFDKTGWKKVEAYLSPWPLKKMDQLRKVFMIEADDGQVVTLAYRRN